MQALFYRGIRFIRWVLTRARQCLDDWLVHMAANSRPGRIQKAVFWLVEEVRLFVQLHVEGLRGRVEIWQGEEIESGCPLRVAFLGDARAYKVHTPKYLQHILFRPGSVQARREGGIFSLAFARRHALAAARQADLVVVEGNELLCWDPPHGKWFWAPSWVRMVLDYSTGITWDEIEKRMHAHKRNYKIACSGAFTCAVSHEEADFDLFYDRMYVPMMEERHGDYAVIDTREGLRDQFHQGQLMLIYRAGEGSGGRPAQPLAGMLLYFHANMAFGIANGVLDGDCQLYDQGVVSALYYHVIRWCYQNKLLRFDVGGVRPFQTDGLYIYKHRWGLRPARDVWHGRDWLFWAPENAPGAPVVLAWLRAHPLIDVEGIRTGEATHQASPALEHGEV